MHPVIQKYKKQWDLGHFVCVGLDPEVEKIPHVLKNTNDDIEDLIFEFNKAIIDATHEVAATFKPNSAFYEAEGEEGWEALKKTTDYIKSTYPEIPVILDAKRADIGNTSRMYAKAAFDYFQADAVTVYPHVGRDALEPFFEYKDKITIVLVKTSNPDSKMFMDIDAGGKPYYMRVAEGVASWNLEQVGVFVGATYPKEMREVRNVFPDALFLTAGVGAQKANEKEIVQAGLDASGQGIVFNASRSILYASSEEDFAQKAREEAQSLSGLIESLRK